MPWIAHLGAAAQVVPLAAVAVARRRVRGARAWVLCWCAVLLAVDAAALSLGRAGKSNLLLFDLVTPVGGVLVLWALSSWQMSDLARLTLRLAIVPFLAVWAALTLSFEQATAFSRLADPMAKLLCLGAAVFTLVERSRNAHGPLSREDWFWVSGGMALYFGTAAALSPLSALLVREAPDLVVRAYEVKSVLDVVAFLAIARGVTCPAAI